MRRWLITIYALLSAIALGYGGHWIYHYKRTRDFAPNVVLIVIDALRADHLSQYGYQINTSPALHAFTRESTLFMNAYAPTSWTRASMASLFTGMYPTRHQVIRPKYSMNDAVVTLAEALLNAGWQTAGFSLNPHVSKKSGLHAGFEQFHELFSTNNFVAYRDVAKLLDHVRHWFFYKAKNKFFLYFHPMNVHGPYRIPKRKRSVLLGRPPVPGFKYYGSIMKDILVMGKIERRKKVNQIYLRSLQEQYDTAVRYTSDQVADFLTYLKKFNVYDQSLIIITSDHGEELFDHGGFSHGFSLYREVLHVPLWIKLPKQRQSRIVHHPVSLIDIYPTVLDVLGINVQQTIDGHSRIALLRGEDNDNNGLRQFFSVDVPERCVARAIQEPPWKLIVTILNYERKENTVELYHIENDLYEKDDVAIQHPEVVKDLKALLNDQYARWKEDTIEAEQTELDPETLEQLRALGYINT